MLVSQVWSGDYIGGQVPRLKKKTKKVGDWESQRFCDRRWWSLPSWNNPWVHPKHACASAPATNASEWWTSRPEMFWSMVIQDGHLVSMCIFELEVITTVLVFWLRYLIGFWSLGHRGGFKLLTPKMHQMEFMLNMFPKSVVCFVWYMLSHAHINMCCSTRAAFTRSNGDDFRWSKRKTLASHRYSPMCSLDTSKV